MSRDSLVLLLRCIYHALPSRRGVGAVLIAETAEVASGGVYACFTGVEGPKIALLALFTQLSVVAILCNLNLV